MTFEEAKKTLVDGYQSAGLTVKIGLLNPVVCTASREFPLTETDISEFVQAQESLQDMEFSPNNCSIVGKNYREQLLTELGRQGLTGIRRERGLSFTFGTPPDGLHIILGEASSLFKNAFRFSDGYLSIYLKWLRFSSAAELQNPGRSFVTIRTVNLGADSVKSAIAQSDRLIENCLFDVCYLHDVAFSVADDWPTRRPYRPPFVFRKTPKCDQYPIAKADYNADTVRFYQRAVSTLDPVTQFLSFYQVLEYHFIAVSDEILYAKLARRINDPKFTTRPHDLDPVIQDVLNHNRETNETEMLKAVLNKYVGEQTVIDFVRDYETYLSEPLYTKKRDIFGEEIGVQLNAGHVFGNLAKRIKTIRNALVHSSDRHQRAVRFIPQTTTLEKMIRREIPLLRVLAEAVIIGSATQ
jgi:hypothetical protein